VQFVCPAGTNFPTPERAVFSTTHGSTHRQMRRLTDGTGGTVRRRVGIRFDPRHPGWPATSVHAEGLQDVVQARGRT
jgi:hypothetical protein